MIQKLSKRARKGIALLCALALVITIFPVTAGAAAKPKFSKKYTTLYENDAKKGVYTYTVKNLTKGQKVKWSVSGTGKSYARLKKKTTTASSSSVSNTLTIKTKGKTAAKNKIVNVTAKVYSGSGKLLYTLSSGNAKIKVMATKVSIQSDALSEKQLYVGLSYQFKYKLTPANATSTNTWTVTSSTGADVSSYITQGGVFTPKTDGKFTIKITAKNGSNATKTATKTVTVAAAMTDARQTAADKITAVYSSSVKNIVKQKDFTLTKSTGAKVDIREISFSENGKEVILTTFAPLENDVKYTLTDGTSEYSFTAKIGKPVSLKVLTTKATVGKETTIEYGVYDANGIEVSSVYGGTISYSDPDIKNGYLIEVNNQIYMTGIGDVGTFKLTYVCSQDPTIVLNAFAQITCTPATIADDTNFTLTTTESAPDYTAASYKDNRRVASGNNYYIHFRALDADKSPFNYDSIKYESSDPDTLLINNHASGGATATAIKNGTVKVIVTATYGQQNYVYTYEVTVAEAAYLTRIRLDKTTLSMSTNVESDYAEYINVTAIDQYGEAFLLENETAQIVDNSTLKLNLAEYDAKTNRVKINTTYASPGTYYYTLTISCDGRQASAGFSVLVQTPPTNGTLSYRVNIDTPVMDLALTKDTDLNDLPKITIRMAEYRGGVFNMYIPIESVTIVKNNRYYSDDLTQTPSDKKTSIGSGQQIPVQVYHVEGSVCSKAETGTYTVTVQFYPNNGTSTGLATSSTTFTLKDSQAAPEVNVRRSTASKYCATALELAQDCISISGATNAVITECVVTGSSTAGSAYKISSGEAVNIKSITVQVQTTVGDGQIVVSQHSVNIGKTLKNL